MDLLQFTKSLIEIDSAAGREQEIVRFLKNYLQSQGYQITLQEVKDGRCNLYAKKKDPVIVLSTHTDTVNPYIPYSEDEEWIYGRGACDAKGILACQVMAAERLQSEMDGQIGLLFLAGEESGSEGAQVANSIPNNSRFLINGEPTENKLALGSKGALRCRLSVKGKAAHSAYPEKGDSAVHRLLDVLQDIRRLSLPADDILGETSVNIGTISGGIQANVVADYAESEFMFRTVSETDLLRKKLEDIVQDRAMIDIIFSCNPLLLEPVEGFETTVVSYTTDVPMLNRWGKPFLLGPGSILDAHTPHEKIKKQDLQIGIDRYCKLIQTLTNK